MSYWKSYVENNKEMKKTCDLLDTLDIYRYLEKYKEITPGDLMDIIEEDYDYPLNYPPFDGYLFNWFSSEDFMEYCLDRYGTVWGEQTTYHLLHPGKRER